MLRPARSRWTVSPTRTRLERVRARSRASTARSTATDRTSPVGGERQRRRGVEPPAAGPRIGRLADGRERCRGRPQASSGIAAASAQSSGGQIRSSVSVRASPASTTGWRTSQRRKRRFVTRPRTTVVVERAGEPVEGRRAVRRPRPRSSRASGRTGRRSRPRLDPGVDPDPLAGRPAERLDPPGRRQEAGLGVLGVEADLDRVTGRRRRSRCRSPSGSPAAIRSWSATRSRPVTSSVTGCSTWRRVFISRKRVAPRSSSRNSQVPALT